MKDTILKQYINGMCGKDRFKTHNFRCERCGNPFDGKMYIINLPTRPIEYGTDSNPDISLMYPHMILTKYVICENCFNTLKKFMED